MFSHVMLGTDNFPAAKKFYDATLTALGHDISAAMVDEENQRVMYMTPDGMLGVGRPKDGKPTSVSNGFTLGFKAKSVEEVQAWNKAALANGGVNIEDPMGERRGGAVYVSYMRDPDGHKLACGYKK